MRVGSHKAYLHGERVDKPDCDDTKDLKFTVSEIKNSCKLKVVFGSSANIAGGELSDSLSLFSLAGTAGLDLSISYRSQDGYDGSLGTGWHHGYDIVLSENEFDEVVLVEGNGRYLLYRPDAAGGYRSQSGDYAVLTSNPAGGWTRTLKSGDRQHFDAEGKLVSIVDRNGNALTFTYEGDLLRTVTDDAGRTVAFSYDAAGKLTSVTDPAGNAYLFTVSETLESVTFPDGGTYTYAYGDNAFLTAKTDPLGNLTTYDYDDEHRVISSTDPEGRTRSIAYPQGDETIRTTTFIEKDGSVWQYTYDATAGDLLAKTDPEGNTTSYTYDADHNATSKTDASGTTYYTYDAGGNMTSVTDVAGQTTAYTYNAFGQVTSITDSEGHVTTYEYDNKGNLTKTTDPTGAATSYTYDSAGHMISVTDAAGSATTMAYDAEGNMTGVTDSAGNTIRFEYDANGRIIRQADPQGNATNFEYDTRGNLIKVVDPLGNVTVSTYDAKGNKISTTDANGNMTRYEYNAQGQVGKQTDAEGNVTTYAYGGSSCPSCGGGNGEKLTSLTDANGHTTTFEYDSLGRLVKETDPLGNETVYTYDAKGNLATRADGKGQTIRYSYDALGRLLKKSYPDGKETTFTYDAKGNILTAANANAGYGFAYDAAGRMTGVSDNEGRLISYEYDAAGRKTRMIAPDGNQLRYEYDAAGRLAAIHNGEDYAFTYDNLGRRSTLTYPNGVTTTYSYDEAGRLTGLLAVNSGGQIIAKSAYALDKVGNRLAKTTEQRTTAYGYDKIYQLLEAVQSTPGFSAETRKGKKGQGVAQAVENQKEFYVYDPVGNRLQTDQVRSYSHDAGNELLTADGTSFRYDKNGNLQEKIAADGITTYTWDYENRLTQVNLPDGSSAAFKYDPFGRRIEKKAKGNEGIKTTRYVYDNEDILYETDESGTMGNRYVHGPGVDEPFALHQGNNTYYYHADGLGSIVALTDDAGRVIQVYEYDSYGNLHDLKNRIKQPYAYTGREWDKEIGLYYYRARYYDPMEGRFIAKDPIGFKGGINLFAYAQNNPIRFVDPMGLKVSLCGATANIPFNIIQLKHFWLKTDTYEVGLGPANGGVPGENGQVDSPYISDTTLTNHSGRSEKPGASCVELTNVDESCVDCELSQMGIPKGKWTSMNNCVTAVLQIISKCQK